MEEHSGSRGRRIPSLRIPLPIQRAPARKKRRWSGLGLEASKKKDRKGERGGKN